MADHQAMSYTCEQHINRSASWESVSTSGHTNDRHLQSQHGFCSHLPSRWIEQMWMFSKPSINQEVLACPLHAHHLLQELSVDGSRKEMAQIYRGLRHILGTCMGRWLTDLWTDCAFSVHSQNPQTSLQTLLDCIRQISNRKVNSLYILFHFSRLGLLGLCYLRGCRRGQGTLLGFTLKEFTFQCCSLWLACARSPAHLKAPATSEPSLRH